MKLSPDGLALAEATASGVSVARVRLVGLTSRSPGETNDEYAPQLANAIKSRLPVSQSTNDGNISQSDFETVVAKFGDNKSAADELFAALDGKHDGAVRNAEWLDAVGDMASAPSDSPEQRC